MCHSVGIRNPSGCLAGAEVRDLALIYIVVRLKCHAVVVKERMAGNPNRLVTSRRRDFCIFGPFPVRILTGISNSGSGEIWRDGVCIRPFFLMSSSMCYDSSILRGLW